ncbi:hypothetical protein LCGC14_0459960 [marine sediment metagenome]|uniref:Uncharacterized protein n=1 Tax=marine sediment metagenome TaxID=412755 RepID=A0A0F9VP76_9ZZZZ|nr:hypothetical protein [bacterium]
MISRRNFDIPPNPFQVERNELLNRSIINYIDSFSVEPYRIGELTTIFKEKDILLLGAPGVGKSSLIRLLVWDVLIEINENHRRKFDFLSEFLYVSDKTKKLPFFGIYINLNEDMNKDFYGTRLRSEEWMKLFFYYFSLFVISKFIYNIKQYTSKIQCNDVFLKEIKWEIGEVPQFISKTKNLTELNQKIKSKLIDIQNFLISFDSIQEKKKKLKFFSTEFFSISIENIINSLNVGFNRIILILDDLSWLPDQLIDSILSFFGRRYKNLEIKLSSRDKSFITDKVSKLDRRDLILIDFDYLLMNYRKKRFYNRMAEDIIKRRMSKKGYFFGNINEVFPSINQDKEADFYSNKINIIENDAFFINCIKKMSRLMKIEELLVDLLDLKIELKESLIIEKINEYKITNFIVTNAHISNIIYLIKIYEKLNEIKNPLDRKILEILTARKFNGNLSGSSLRNIFDILDKEIENIKKNKNLTKISLYLLAREATQLKLYSGLGDIVKISSFVIKDLLELLEVIFSKYISWQMKEYGSIFDNPIIPSKIQSEAIYEYAKKKIKINLLKSTKYGVVLYKFFEGLNEFFKDQFEIQASYQNGRSGFALSTLEECVKLKRSKIFSEALANSYLISKDISKGYEEHKKKSDYVFYLHRVICVFYGWPIALGGYKYTRYEDVMNFLLKGMIPPKKKIKQSLMNFIKRSDDI